MTQLLERKVGEFSVMDALLVAASKQVTERVIARTPIGNGTMASGITKLIGAFILTGLVKGKIGSIVGTGMMVDGGEDLISNFLGGVANAQSQTQGVIGLSNQGAGVAGLI